VLATESDRPNTKPAPEERQQCADRGAHDDLHDGARNGDGAHAHQVGNREMQPHAEHQQDHADLGQLIGELYIRDEAGRMRADDHAGQQVAEDGRQSHAMHQQAEQERQPETRCNRCD
jgi:hypothetical protein